MVILKLITFILFSLLLTEAPASEFRLLEVIVNCENSGECKEFQTLFETLKGEKLDLAIVKEKVKFALKDPMISSLQYEVYTQGENRSSLVINISLKKRIRRISYESNIEIPFDQILPYLQITEGSIFDESVLPRILSVLNERLYEKGFRGISIDPKITTKDHFIDIKFNVKVGDVVRVSSIKVKSSIDDRVLDIYRKFRKFKDSVWDRVNIKVVVDDFTEELFEQGFYYSRVNSMINEISPGEVELAISVDFNERTNFYFRGNTVFSRGELVGMIEKQLRNEVKMFSTNSLAKFLDKKYNEVGIYGSEIEVYKRAGWTNKAVSFENYYVELNEGRKIILEEVSYRGNNAIGVERLGELYEEKGSVLAARGYLDAEFLNKYTSLIREEYLKNGFVFVEVSKPIIEIDNKKNTAVVKYEIKEKQAVNISRINLHGVPKILSNELVSFFVNREGANINVVELQSDINSVQDGLRNRGYYFATVKNANQGNVVTYNNSFTKAEINLEVDLQKKTVFDGLLITGTQKTRREVVEREVNFVKGDIVTPDKLENLKNRLTALGLFSQVRISPYIVNKNSEEKLYKANVLIQVREKDFGSAEVAPGFRTDLGVKLSVGVSYNNLWGNNHTVGLKGQVNQRLDTSNINTFRREHYKKMTEFLTRANYFWPHVMGSKLGLDFEAQYQRRRYFDFDADIFKSSVQATRDIWNYQTTPKRGEKSKNYSLSASLRYQLETISQYNASDSLDNDDYRIGGFTPGLSLDLRDDPIDPRNGAFFGVSWEFANPALGSLEEEDLVVDFSKLVSRNKLYYSIDNLTLAFSLSLGVEKNNATELKADSSTRGFIPSIKVFRLDGVDTVRGFANEEINLLERGQDIGDVVVTNKAYFANLKFEPRFRATDNFIWGPFFDAGRVYVDSFKPLDLRTSTGITLKLLTPVGSLDFDYGIKLKKRKLPSGDQEQFGRFHLSIGYF